MSRVRVFSVPYKPVGRATNIPAPGCAAGTQKIGRTLLPRRPGHPQFAAFQERGETIDRSHNHSVGGRVGRRSIALRADAAGSSLCLFDRPFASHRPHRLPATRVARPAQALPEPHSAPSDELDVDEPLGAEDQSAEDDRPRIPEPMVFDLVRPLGARRGEFEINALGLFPLSGTQQSTTEFPDALGLESARVEWAPELEYAVRDGLALEFELPFVEGTLGAYKAAAQWTFGTAFERRFTHGVQEILQYDRNPGSWLPTVLYLAGFRFNEVWSALGMLGVRGNTAADRSDDGLEGIINLSLFADVAAHVSLGLETNVAETLSGKTALLVMPQLHWEVTDHIMIQGGAGARLTNERTVPEAAVRVIRSF